VIELSLSYLNFFNIYSFLKANRLLAAILFTKFL